MDEAAYLERQFELDGGALVVRFCLPSREPGGEFKCRYSIGWPERERRSYACGLDSVQALILAMRVAHTELVTSAAYQAGRLTWCDEADLDLPPAWGDEPSDGGLPTPDDTARPGPA